MTVARALGIAQEDAGRAALRVIVEIRAADFFERSSLPMRSGMRALHLYLTRQCNLRCPYCYAQEKPSAKRRALTEREWRRVIDDYLSSHSGGRVAFSGGEPLLRVDCVPLAQHARAAGAETVLFTNGRMLRRVPGDVLAQAFDRVQITLDGASAGVHDAMRGRGSHAAVIGAVRHLGASGVPVTLALNVFPASVEDYRQHFLELYESLKDGKPRVVLGHDLLLYGRGPEFRSPEFASAAFVGSVAALVDVLGAHGIVTSAAVRNLRFDNCGICDNIVVDDDGTVHPCVIPCHPIADVRTDSFGSVIERLDRLHDETRVDRFSECLECDLRHLCGGGCRMHNLLLRKSVWSTGCTRTDFERKLAFMALDLPAPLKS